jgi:hypothetical protein
MKAKRYELQQQMKNLFPSLVCLTTCEKLHTTIFYFNNKDLKNADYTQFLHHFNDMIISQYHFSDMIGHHIANSNIY